MCDRDSRGPAAEVNRRAESRHSEKQGIRKAEHRKKETDGRRQGKNANQVHDGKGEGSQPTSQGPEDTQSTTALNTTPNATDVLDDIDRYLRHI